MFTYKNVSPYYLMVPMVGEVNPGDTLQSELELESPHLELVSEPEAPRIAPAAPVATIAAQVVPNKEDAS